MISQRHLNHSKSMKFWFKNLEGFVYSIQIPLLILLAPSSSDKGAKFPPISVLHHPGHKITEVWPSFRYFLTIIIITESKSDTTHSEEVWNFCKLTNYNPSYLAFKLILHNLEKFKEFPIRSMRDWLICFWVFENAARVLPSLKKLSQLFLYLTIKAKILW